jgi:hypothetical protein
MALIGGESFVNNTGIHFVNTHDLTTGRRGWSVCVCVCVCISDNSLIRTYVNKITYLKYMNIKLHESLFMLTF